MNISAPFIKRPVATSLLSMGLLLLGGLAYPFLPTARLPEVEYPTITVFSNLPGASPETMATAVATPLERMFGRIAGITQMTSTSQLGSTNITMQFDLNRSVDAAARDVQAAINSARGQLPANLPTNPNWRKVNPADSDFMNLAVTSDTATRPELYDVRYQAFHGFSNGDEKCVPFTVRPRRVEPRRSIRVLAWDKEEISGKDSITSIDS